MDINSLFKLILLTSAMGSLVACIVLLMKKIFRNKLSPTWHYYIWLIVLIRLLLPNSLNSCFSIFNAINFSEQHIQISELQIKANQPNTNLAPQINKENSSSILSSTQEPAKVIDTTNHSEVPAKAKTYLNTTVISIVWIIGMSITALFILIAYILFSIRLSFDYLCMDKETIDIFNECKNIAGYTGYVPVICSKNITTPSLCGILKPKILIPSEVIPKFNSDEKKYIFLHELVHLKRKDILINWIMTLLLIIHWFNPILWICFSKIKKDCEISCDAATLTYLNPIEYQKYGETLIKLIKIAPKTHWSPGTAAIINKREIKRRIIMISKFRKKPLLWSIVAIFLTLAVGCTGLTNRKNYSQSDNLPKEAPSSTLNKTSPSTTNKGTENIATTEASASNTNIEPPELSDEQLITLINNGDISVRNLYKVYDQLATKYNESDGNFTDIKENITDTETLTLYLNEQLNLNSYFSNEFIGKFISYVFKKIDGKYCARVGNFDLGFIIKEIAAKKYEGNKLYTTFTVKNNLYNDYGNISAVLIYTDGKWIIDKMDTWGIPYVGE